MGRIPLVDDATQHHQGVEFQEIHQSPAADTAHDAPPLLDEDLFEPPPSYQPPPAATKPPLLDEDLYEPPPSYKPPPAATTPPAAAQPFPPRPQIPAMVFVAQENQAWKSNLFDCMNDPQNAIITLFFPCVTFGQIAEILDNGSTSCATSGILYSCIAFCIGMPCLMSCGYRSKLRAKFGLVESPASDCLIHCFCEHCALCQEYRELNDRGFDPSIGHAGNEAKQRRQQFGMTPPMQQRMM